MKAFLDELPPLPFRTPGIHAGFFDMYGPDAQRLDNLLLDRFERLGHDRQRMYLYRAAYAITTATIYDADDGDGHYVWCVGNLNRLPR